MEQVASAFPCEPGLDADPIVRAGLHVLARHVSGGEIEDVKRNLPQGLRPLWD
jgi:uncharacterized protein (DUF2267 family)